MAYQLVHNVKENKYEYHIDDYVAYVTYDDQHGEMHLTHTVVPEALSGKGLAKMLLEDVLKQIKADNKKAVPQCSYIVRYKEKYPESHHYFA